MRFCRWGALFVALFSAASSFAAIPPQERAALIAIYNALDGPNWKHGDYPPPSRNWLGPVGTECKWDYVTCDAAESTVTELSVSYTNAKGVLPREIGDLSNLEMFVGVGSDFTGPLPPEIGRLTKLRILNLEGTAITGLIPRELGQLTSLRELLLGRNAFTGPIPEELASLSNIEVLDTAYNPLQGTIPPAILRMPNLRRLHLDGDNLTGAIPAINLPKLEHLDLGENNLTGPIPPVNLPKLEYLNLGGNDLTGPIPTSLGDLVMLKEVYLDNNRLSGPIPAEIRRLTELRVFYVYSNQLEGNFPDVFTLVKLTHLGLASNRLTGPMHQSIGRLQDLVELYTFGNSFSGPLPQEFFTLKKLKLFDSAGTRFSGDLADLAKLTSLEHLNLRGNDFRGPFPVALTQLENLRGLNLEDMPLGGSIPGEVGRLTKLTALLLGRTQIGDPMPETIGNLTGLIEFTIDGNNFTRLPASFEKLTNLKYLDLSNNRLTGLLPAAAFAKMTEMLYLWASDNQFDGAIPPEIFSLTKLGDLRLDRNRLSGPIPSVAQAVNLSHLELDSNQLTAFPNDLASLQKLGTLYVGANRISGRVPAAIASLTSLSSGRLDIGENALFTDDPAVKAFLDLKDPDWERTQTVPPRDVRVTAQRERSITLNWTPIPYSSGPGGYLISYATSPSGPFEVLTTAPNKSTLTFIADGLERSTNYYFVIETVSYPSGRQQNLLTSEPTATIATSTTTGAPAPPSIVVYLHPSEIRQRPGASDGTASYVIGNVGDLPGSVSLSQTKTFFTQSPSSFTLAGGATQRITLSGTPQQVGAYVGESVLSGDGVVPGTSVRVSMLVTEPPAGTVSAKPSANRIDVAARDTGTSGTVDFINTGNATLQGIVISNAAWIIPPDGLIVIPAGERRTVTFTVDQAKRPDATSPGGAAGAVIGTLSLIYESGAAGKRAIPLDGPGVSTTTPVTVVYTITPPVQAVTVPPIPAGEVAVFLAGVGNLVGVNARTYISDVSLLNVFGTESPRDIRMYYTPLDTAQATKLTDVKQLEPGQGITFANVVKTVFETDKSQGTLQIRTRSIDQLFVNANIFNVSDPNGTYGTALPVLRSDRSATAGQSIFLTGLLRDEGNTVYTNMYVQETGGGTSNFEIDYLDAAGKSVGTRSGSVGPFRLAALGTVPVGTVAARIANTPGSSGRIGSFGTPVDVLSGDFWTVSDWNRELAAPLDEPVIIPAAGWTPGSLGTFFKTDIAISNRSAATANGTFTYFARGGGTGTKDITLAGGESAILSDFIGTAFSGLGYTIGYLEFAPRSGAFSLTARIFAISALPGTFGTGIPVVPRGSALRLGQSKTIAGLDVASLRTISGSKPGTFRTNIGIAEIDGKPTKVRVTVIYPEIRQTVTGIRVTSKDYTVPPHESVLEGLAGLIESTNSSFSDLRNVQVKFQVIGGEGAVIAYTSSVDNGSADQVMRIQ